MFFHVPIKIVSIATISKTSKRLENYFSGYRSLFFCKSLFYIQLPNLYGENHAKWQFQPNPNQIGLELEATYKKIKLIWGDCN